MKARILDDGSVAVEAETIDEQQALARLQVRKEKLEVEFFLKFNGLELWGPATLRVVSRS